MDETWKCIKEFPRYEVSNMGSVRRIGKTTPLVAQKAKGGAWFVKLTTDSGVTSKSIKGLVAEAFVPKPDAFDPEIFNTPIQLTMSTDVIRADKIVWRPLWHAVQYRRQFHPNLYPLYYEMPVMNLMTRNQHASILSAAIHDGVLMKDIYRSAGQGKPVFPDGYRYEFMFRIWENLGTVHTEWV